VADRNRGGRPGDDSVDEPLEDDFDEDLEDEDLDEELEDVDEDEQDAAPARRGRAAAATRERTVNRTRTKVASDRPSIFGRLARYLREIVAELQKVIWPTRKELLTYTAVVLVFVTLVMSYVAGLDVGFAKLMFIIFGSGNDSAASAAN
jgi:preprotein translocase subunit SecE